MRNGGVLLKLNIATLALILTAAVLFATQAAHMAWTPWRIAGLAIAAPSLLLLAVARLQLGRAFSIQARASQLVTTGLCSRIRNPIYVFGALMGVILFTGRPWFLLLLAVVVLLQVYRGRKEAQVLQDKFGPAYLEYKRNTWF